MAEIITLHSEDISPVVTNITEEITSIFEEKDTVILGVVGGRSVANVYKELIHKNLDFSKIHIFFLDERFTPLFSEESNSKVIQDSLASKIPEDNIHYFNHETQFVKDYYDIFCDYGGRFDIVVLGAGEDSHVASLFPDHDSIKSDSVGFIEVDNAPKPPARRMSVSRKLLSQARYAHLLFLGEGKKDAFKEFSNNAIHITNCPSKIIKETDHGIVYKNFDI